MTHDASTLGERPFLNASTGRLNSWLVLATVLFILSPKINIIQISGQTSGIRADDVFLLLVFPYLLMRIRNNLAPIHSLRLYMAFVGLAFFSAILNADSNGLKLLLYPLRLIEYTAFLILGTLCTSRRLLVTVASIIVLLNTGIAVGQMFLNWGGFHYSRYAVNVGARAIGLTAGPWEMAAFVNIALAYLAYAWRRGPENMSKFLTIYLIALVCMILSGSRVGLVVNTLIVTSFFISLEVKFRQKLLGFVAALVISVLTFAATPNSLADRSRALLEQGNLDYSHQIGQQSGCQSNKAGRTLDFAVVENGKHDPSWGVRAQKWATAVCVFVQSPSNYFFGVGPGYFGPALDGGFLRVLVEHGAIGLLLLLASLAGVDTAFRNHRLLATIFAAHMVFIDIYFSYKFMSFLLFVLGAMHVYENNEKEIEHARLH